ncbi:MAG: methyltransferase domain-containing protein [bacterium]|nr:methyltransferase domain-containing protein [bacterium]
MDTNSLQTIQKAYRRGENIVQYLKKGNRSETTTEMVMISYDLQSGSYIKQAQKTSAFHERYTKAIASVINRLGVSYDSILEAGVGEATTLAHLVPKLRPAPKKVYGFDLSWSRVRYGIAYTKKRKVHGASLFTGDLFNIPLADHSIDIVYTSHSIEPNGGREKEALQELARVAKKYLVLLEPAYEFAGNKARQRMQKHGYVRTLYASALSLSLNVVEHRLFDEYLNPLNPTGLMVIKISPKKTHNIKTPFLCPVTKTPLELVKGAYFSREGLLAYPIVDGVPCLLKDNGIIATHFTDNFSTI